MTLASRVTDLVTSIATAINARNVPGASDYQMWLAQGNSGSLADYRTAILGGDVDYATQFNTQLGTVPSAGAASEAQAGVTQLASAADVLSGVLTKSMAPGRAAVRAFASLSTLNAAAGSVPDGTLATLPAFTTTNGKVLASTWRLTNALWYPFSQLKLLNAATLADIKGWPTTYTGLSFDPRFTTALVISDGATAANGWDEYMWIGNTSGFILWRGAITVSGNSGKYGFDTRDNKAWVDGPAVMFELAFKNLSGQTPAQYDQLGLFPANCRPAVDVFSSGAVYPLGSMGWTASTFYTQSGGNINLLTAPPSGGSGDGANVFIINGLFRRVLPTS